jgi:PUA domain protein
MVQALILRSALKNFLLSKSETAQLINQVASVWPQGIFPKVKSVKVYEIEQDKRLLFAGEMVAVQVGNIIVPFLGKAEELHRFPSVTIDMGAIKFVCKGAKVMRPGIMLFDSFKKGDIVVVKDEKHGKAVAVGLALEDSEAAKEMPKGSVIDNLHYVSDKIWKAYKYI